MKCYIFLFICFFNYVKYRIGVKTRYKAKDIGFLLESRDYKYFGEGLPVYLKLRIALIKFWTISQPGSDIFNSVFLEQGLISGKTSVSLLK